MEMFEDIDRRLEKVERATGNVSWPESTACEMER